MPRAIASRRILRFGVFELDSHTGELRKHGVRLRLQGKPLQILQILLESPGQVITRDELRQRLWASDIFVDFDSGLNTAVNRLRLALGDSADSPRYIERPSKVAAASTCTPERWVSLSGARSPWARRSTSAWRLRWIRFPPDRRNVFVGGCEWHAQSQQLYDDLRRNIQGNER